MKTILFDIETVGTCLDSFDEIQKEYLFRAVEKEESENKRKEKYDEVIRSLNLSPLTAKIVAIGLYNVESDKSVVLFQSDKREKIMLNDGNLTLLPSDEKDMLERFWKIVKDCDKFITFNGRSFDAPFIHIRSAILKIHPSKNLIPYRYDSKIHCDLLEQFTYYGLTRKYNLDFYCKAFGIASPKGGEVNGYNINEMFAKKRYQEIAEYCGNDLKATFELYKIFTDYLDQNMILK